MWSSDSDHELASATSMGDSSFSSSYTASPPPSPPASSLRSCRHRHSRRRKKSSAASSPPPLEDKDDEEPVPEAEDVWRQAQLHAAWPGRHHPKPVVLAEDNGEGGVGRSRSLTDDDLEELKGCADLGFGFSYDEIPELRGTLPALELCYSMSQRLLDDHQRLLDDHQSPVQPAPEDTAPAPVAPPVTNWKISSPGDSPDEVKARLKYWAQAVACTVRLCS